MSIKVEPYRIMFLREEVNPSMSHATKITSNIIEEILLRKIQTGFRRKIIQLKTFPNSPNVMRTTAIICKICVYLGK